MSRQFGNVPGSSPNTSNETFLEQVKIFRNPNFSGAKWQPPPPVIYIPVWEEAEYQALVSKVLRGIPKAHIAASFGETEASIDRILAWMGKIAVKNGVDESLVRQYYGYSQKAYDDIKVAGMPIAEQTATNAQLSESLTRKMGKMEDRLGAGQRLIFWAVLGTFMLTCFVIIR